MTYSVALSDPSFGITGVTVDLAGPGGAHLSASVPFSGGRASGTFDVPVVFGSDDPIGVWTVDEVDATDPATTTKFTGLSLDPVTYTDDKALPAGDFALDDSSPVDDWSGPVTRQLLMTLPDPAAVTSVSMDAGSGCTVGGTTASGNQLSVTIDIAEATKSCSIRTLVLSDAAGDVSVYGSLYPGSPTLPGLTATSTTPPVLGIVSLDTTTVGWESGGTVTASVDVHSHEAGVTEVRVVMSNDTTGDSVSVHGDVTVDRATAAVVSVPISVPAHDKLGTYSIDEVTLVDAAGNVVDGTQPAGGQTDWPTFTVLGTGSQTGLSGFTALSRAERLGDSRAPGNAWGRLGAGTTARIPLIFLPANATAAVLNVTAINPTASSYLTVFPDGTPRPGVSNVSFVPGQTVPNLVTVPVRPSTGGGTVDIYNHAGSVDVAVDLVGYYVPDGGSYFVPLSPARVLDTRRSGTGVVQAPVTSGHPVVAHVSVSAPGVTGVLLNVTAINPAAAGNVSLVPDSSAPATSNLNFTAHQTVANLVVVPTSSGDFFIDDHGGSVDIAADIVGYYLAPTRAVGFESLFMPTTPQRILDTRNGIGAPRAALGAGGQVGVAVAGAHGVPATMSAVVLNVTAVGGTASSYLTAYPAGPSRPGTSTLNFLPGSTVTNLAEPGPFSGQQLVIWNHVGSVHVLADQFGYFLPL